LTTIDYRALLDIHKNSGAAATVATRKRESRIDFGVVDVDPQGFLTGWREKPVYEFRVSMGVYVLTPACLRLIAQDEALGMPDLLSRVRESGGKVFCHASDAYWLDIGRVDDYELAQQEFEANKSKFLKARWTTV
jgi:NDP-sugar pyrophosphorylase family protein